MNNLHEIIVDNLVKAQAIVEVTIIEHFGSTPRTAGTKMLVRNDKSIAGTVGGGLYEAQAIDLAHSMYSMSENKSESIGFITYFDLKGNEAPTDMDMVCGGDLRLLLEYIPATKENVELYRALSNAKESGEECVLVTRINAKNVDEKLDALQQLRKLSHDTKQEVELAKALVFTDKAKHTDFGTENLTQEVEGHLLFNKSFKSISNFFSEPYEYVFEKNVKKYALHLFGAGHVACQLAKIADYLEFNLTVLDDRAEFSNAERFPNAKTLVLPSLEENVVMEYLQEQAIGAQDGVIILTRGHARDRDALAATLRHKPGYIGMIGSESKKQTTYEHLRKAGFTNEDFEKVHSPVGLSIGAQTPEEIAISIAGELIMWRAGIL